MINEVPCGNCGTVGPTENWGGTHDSVSLARNPGLIQRWCHQCVLVAQVEHWRKLVPLLAEAERELAELAGAAALRVKFEQDKEHEDHARLAPASAVAPANLPNAATTETLPSDEFERGYLKGAADCRGSVAEMDAERARLGLEILRALDFGHTNGRMGESKQATIDKWMER